MPVGRQYAIRYILWGMAWLPAAVPVADSGARPTGAEGSGARTTKNTVATRKKPLRANSITTVIIDAFLANSGYGAA